MYLETESNYKRNIREFEQLKLFEDLEIKTVENYAIDVKGEIVYRYTFVNGRFSVISATIRLHKNFENEVLIAELNHYYVNRLFFYDTVHDKKSFAFSCFASEVMVHTYEEPCKHCKKLATKECDFYPKF